ncbi:MAG: GNAT family N-acetyltransferase [Nitrococcus mobilis]|nr:GNAT family N-acetyltransferase [Nitrococcus mobilis]
MSVTIRLLNSDDGELLTRVAAGVFDHGINAKRCREFLSDPRHHLAVAVDSGVVVGMASGIHYVHPDKEPELWVNEVGVAPTHRNRGLGKQLLRALLNVGRQLGCTEGWVLTDRSNAPAMRLYASCDGSEAARDQVMFTFKLC